jgi:hypothetical protein
MPSSRGRRAQFFPMALLSKGPTRESDVGPGDRGRRRRRPRVPRGPILRAALARGRCVAAFGPVVVVRPSSRVPACSAVRQGAEGGMGIRTVSLAARSASRRCASWNSQGGVRRGAGIRVGADTSARSWASTGSWRSGGIRALREARGVVPGGLLLPPLHPPYPAPISSSFWVRFPGTRRPRYFPSDGHSATEY